MIWVSCHVLLRNPLVAVVNSGEELPLAVQLIATVANGAYAHVFVKPTWYGPRVLPELLDIIAQTARAQPNLHFTIMAATNDDDLLFRQSGLDSIWCNHNAFLDGRIYKPDLTAEKHYDAVYVARLVDFKRHYLAADVPRMAVITKAYEVDVESARSCLSTYRDLQFVNYDSEKGVTTIEPAQVSKVLTESRCGLALSAEEGPMFASAEYLLTGLPIVTTKSTGGRDVFFHPDYVEVVEDTSESVAAGVARLIARNLDPLMIRERTFHLFMDHRYRLIMRLSGLAQTDLFTQASPNLWLPQFINKLEKYVDPTKAKIRQKTVQ